MKYDYFLEKKFFTSKEVKQILNEFNKCALPNFFDNPDPNATKTAKVKISRYLHLKKLLKNVVELTHDVNNKYFGFNIPKKNDYSVIHLNEYISNNNVGYDWHTDVSRDFAEDFKLTVLINLSKQYTGGNFKLFKCSDINFFDTGDVLIFKSFLSHKVEKITSGERKTLTFWMEGPCFK